MPPTIVNDTPADADRIRARPRTPTLRYLPGLDGLRAISVLAVIVFHHYFVFGSDAGWMPGGFLGVEVFFVVSGYLITSLLARRAPRQRQGLVPGLLDPPRPPSAPRAVAAARGRRRVLAAVLAGHDRHAERRRGRRARST